jgi:hypothetical protein
VDINDGEEGGDAVARSAHELRFVDLLDGVHLAVAGGDDKAGAGRRVGGRIAEEVNGKQGESMIPAKSHAPKNGEGPEDNKHRA